MNCLPQSNSYTNICRTCLIENSNMKSVFGIEEILEQKIMLCDILMQCASVLIIQGDGLPENVCINCFHQVSSAYLFRKLCERSDVALRACSTFTNFDEDQKNILMETIDQNNINTNTANKSTDIDNKNNLKPKTYCDDETLFNENDQLGAEDNFSDNEAESNKNSGVRQRNYKCKKCNISYLSLTSFRAHTADVHGKMFCCEQCGKQFAAKNILARHITSSHMKPTDSKRSRNKTGIIKKRNLPRTCEICNKTFRFHSNLERHKLIHTGEKPYLCNVCGKGFAQMAYLKIHSFIHTGEKPYRCQMCDRSFAAPGTLMTHVRTHTGERPHICKICGKDFPQSGYLSAHIRTHTGEKPVECKVCNRRFNQSGRLIIHMRIHSGEKPFQCKECGRSFAVKGTLKKHMRTHTGERPYTCKVCGQAFAQSGTLATHMKVHKHKTDATG